VAVEGRQAVVGENQLGPELAENARVALARCDVLEDEVEARLLELAPDQLDVRRVVLEVKDAERLRPRLRALPAAGGARRWGALGTGGLVRDLSSLAHVGDSPGREDHVVPANVERRLSGVT